MDFICISCGKKVVIEKTKWKIKPIWIYPLCPQCLISTNFKKEVCSTFEDKNPFYEKLKKARKENSMKKADRREHFMPNGIPKKIRAYDNGGKTYDRYTVVYTGNYKGRNGCDYVGMSEHPFSPQGFGQHGWDQNVIDYPEYSHLGKKIKFEDLPEDCQRLVIDDYKELWDL